jgi:hypothetical protein
MVEAFIEDSMRLNLLQPDAEPRATRYVPPMLEMITALEKKGLAYRGSNGDVFYSVRSFPEYGKLSRRNLDDLRAGERVAVEVAKKDPLDFVLWKAAKPGEPKWPSIFGDGRPGWHIECSAMSCNELGFPFDIHGGGWDLQFPHHENEIAQSEGATGTKFVNYWMHAAFLNIDHEKMSKSQLLHDGDVLNKLDAVQGGEQLRFFLMRGHYRSEVNYSWDTLEDAGNTLRGFYTALREVPPAHVDVDWSNPYAARFRDAMNDDFDTPIAFAVLHDLRGEVNRTKSRELAGLLRALAARSAYCKPIRPRSSRAARGASWTCKRSSTSALRPSATRTTPVPMRSASSWKRPASPSRTKPAARRSGAANSPSGCLAQHAELHRRFHVEEMHVLGFEAREELLRFFFGHRHHDFDGLVGELEEMRRVEAPMLSEPLGGGNHGCAAQPQLPCDLDQPLGDGLAAMAVVLHGDEADLVALHGLTAPSSRSTTRCPGSSPRANLRGAT